MKTIVVGSKNQVKVNAALKAFQRAFQGTAFTAIGAEVASGVAVQPMSDAETLRGALNRAKRVQSLHPKADYWVGIEGGIEQTEYGMAVFAWIVVCSPRGEGRGRTGAFFLPPAIEELVRQGDELGVADDKVFGRTNSKQSNGSVGILTNDLITRTDYYEHAVLLALIPELQPELWPAA
ncbi:MAG: inosine/xanthosine triphosphatase [Oligoflexia bacterium]|nr:inosine/xanthosine triphosphatase [Oligoflexia bacterium]